MPCSLDGIGADDDTPSSFFATFLPSVDTLVDDLVAASAGASAASSAASSAGASAGACAGASAAPLAAGFSFFGSGGTLVVGFSVLVVSV